MNGHRTQTDRRIVERNAAARSPSRDGLAGVAPQILRRAQGSETAADLTQRRSPAAPVIKSAPSGITVHPIAGRGSALSGESRRELRWAL